jgi:parvulin-like peptidyl-prolyl isomerase
MSMKSRTLAGLCVAALAIVASACGSSSSSTASLPTADVAMIGGTGITRTAFDHLMTIGLASYTSKQQPAPKPGTTEYETLKQQALNYLFEQEIVKQEAQKAGIKVDQKAVDAQVQAAKTQAGGDAAFTKELTDAKVTLADFRDGIVAQQLAQKLFDKVSTSFAPVTDADIAARYAKDKETTYKVPESRKVQHILLGEKGGATPTEKQYAELKKKADQVVKQLDGGASFNSLVKKYSTDTASVPNNGEYSVTPTGFDPAFTKAAYALKTGSYTETPVKSAFGYHIIKALSDTTKASYKPLSEVKAQIKAQIENERKRAAAVAWYDKVKASYLSQAQFAKGYSLPPTTTAPASTASGATTG